MIPKIISFGYRNYEVVMKQRIAVCNTCGSKIKDGVNTTSNFVRHLRLLHKARFEEYNMTKGIKMEPQQHSTLQYQDSTVDHHSATHPLQQHLTLQYQDSPVDHHSATHPLQLHSTLQYQDSPVGHHSATHPTQNSITNAIVSDLIIDCNLPLAIVENKSFLHFLNILDSKYSPVCRRTLASKIENLAEERRSKLKTQLTNSHRVAVTVDIWSDRRRRGFLGVTVHWIERGPERIELKTNLLACNRFRGSHTAEKIWDQFEAVCHEYGIKHKLDYIIHDSAADMGKAFTVSFPRNREDGYDGDLLDDPELWFDIAQDDQQIIQDGMAEQHRLQCFAHTLQLVLGDGLKEAKVLSLSLSKVSTLGSLLHTSSPFKDMFDDVFGKHKGVPASDNARWHSTLSQVRAVLHCDHLRLNAALEVAGQTELSFTLREWNMLTELVDILKPFGEATELTQGGKVVTISAVVPSVLSLNHHLEKLKPEVRYLSGLVRSLHESLKERFLGIFINVNMAGPLDGIPAPFSDPVYLKAAALDPAFALLWVEPHVLVSPDIKAEVVQHVKDLILHEAAETEPLWPVKEEEEHMDIGEGGGLFAAYRKRQRKDVGSTPALQLSHYLDIAEGQNALLFWAMNMETLPLLFPVALRVLALPASSAPLERVVSHGGVMLRPHRAQMTDRLLADLIFCKCNAA